MSDIDALDERLAAVERALTDGDDDLTDLRDAADLAREVETLSARLDDVEDRVDELDAATQALRGYVGNVRAVNRSVEQRADAALAKAEALAAGERPDASAGTDEPAARASGASGDGIDGDGRPCRCQARRCDRDGVASGCAADAELDRNTDAETDHDDPGLLARIAEAL